MKTSKHQISKKLIAGSLSLMILLSSANLLAANSNPDKKESKAEKETIESLKTTFEFNTELPAEEIKNYKIYDANDNLVHEVKLSSEMKSQNKKLIKYLLIADFVMEYDNTKYYKIN